MSVSQSQIDALNAAIGKGERIVRHGDKMIEFRSTAELIQARDDLQKQLSAQSGAGRPRQTLLTQSGRGY